MQSAELFPWPEEPAAWVRELLGDGVRVVAADDTATDLGWPVTILDLDAGGEARVLALYKFLEWGGLVQVTGIRDAAAADAVLEALRGARPDFGGDEAVCLAELLP